ncbi:hypothetical protein BY458DRAFT_428803 [Sporodiniella umbellata]|nr:hypothetical protein BY458DRAFT_428803 [Sporodiniella umbellata]
MDTTVYLPQHQYYIKSYMKKGYSLVGYIQQFSEDVDLVNEEMIELVSDNMRFRSFVNKVFVSPCCKKGQKIMSRDQKLQQGTLQYGNIHGN